MQEPWTQPDAIAASRHAVQEPWAEEAGRERFDGTVTVIGEPAGRKLMMWV